jgi:hypothetical protein
MLVPCYTITSTDTQTNIHQGICPSTLLWASRNDIENFQYGLENRIYKTEGWLWERLVLEGLVADTQEALRERRFQAYQAQKVFIMAQKQLIPPGWNPIDPLNSVKRVKGDGKFMSLQKLVNPVPENILTASSLRYAYGVKKETFRRWMGQGAKFPERIPVDKEKNIIEHHEMEQYMLTGDGKNGSKAEKKTHREFLKQNSKQLPDDVMDVYVSESLSRAHGVPWIQRQRYRTN